jgi:hypothetical protein
MPDTPLTKQGYSVDDLTREFPLSKGFWWSEINSRRLRGTRFGRRVIVLKNDLEAYLKSKQIEAGSGPRS